jgi:hypothetical protein
MKSSWPITKGNQTDLGRTPGKPQSGSRRWSVRNGQLVTGKLGTGNWFGWFYLFPLSGVKCISKG